MQTSNQPGLFIVEGDGFIDPNFKEIYSNTIETRLPDGSSYLQIILPQNPLLLKAYFDYILGNLAARRNENEFRLLFSNKELAELFLSYSNLQGFSIHHGKTNYFELNTDSIHELAETLASKAEGYYIDDAVWSDELRDLISNSFSFNYEENKSNESRKATIDDFLATYEGNIYTKTFQIRQNGSNALLASFTFLPLNNEVQLHSVAGRPMNELLLVEGKLEIIMYFVLKELIENHPGKPLTFNSSGAAKVYRRLGISDSPRYGIVLKRETN